MARIYAAKPTVGPMFYGAIGGMLAGLGALAVMTAASVLMGSSGSQASNAVGAWLVRWLQVSDPDSLARFYTDATLGGIALMAIVGALVGAVLAGLLARFPEDQPLAWGAIAGAVLWAVTWWGIGPALSPVLVRTVDWRVLLATCMVYGLVLGWWLRIGRRRSETVASRLQRP
jgi:hypothetical protein